MSTVLIKERKNFIKLQKELIKQKKNFSIEKNSYTIKAIVGDNSFLFTDERVSRKIFIANKMILRDCKDVYIDFLPVINFFDFTDLKKNKSKNIFGVDISAAYPTTLYVNNLIKKETFNYLMRLPKKDRLKAIGMCAKRKTILIYENGQIKKVFEERSESENIYFFCQYEIGNLMIQLKNIFKKDFLFFWFDGIYFKTKEAQEFAYNFLNKKGFKVKKEDIKNLKIFNNRIEYFKEKKKKVLFLPNKYFII